MRPTLRPRLEQLEERLAPALGGGGPPPPITAAGKVLLGVELQPISGVIATFVADGQPASAFGATILWGDGRWSPGTVSQGGGSNYSD